MSDIDEDEEGNRQRVLSNGQVMAFIARFWLRRRGMLFVAVAGMLIGVLCDLMIPTAAGHLVDTLTAAVRDPAKAWQAWGLLVGVYVAYTIFRNIAFRFWNPLAAANMREMSDEGFRKVQSFSADWHADNFAGATVRKLSRAMWGYDAVSDAVILWLGPALVVLFGLSVQMMFKWPLVGLLAMSVVAGFLALNIWVVRIYVRPANLRSNALDSRIGGALADAITANPTVKAFGAEPREEARFGKVTEAWSSAVQVTWGRFMDIWLAQNLMMVALLAGMTGMVVNLWSQGKASTGDIAYAITAFLQMSGYLRNIGENVRMMQKGIDDVEDVAGYARMAPQVADPAGAPDFVGGLGEVVFDHVTFRYKSAAEAIYEDFSLTLQPGERVALVGATGAGKSTFVKLIQRLYDLDGGAIRIDGQDIAAVSQGSLRRAIALVPQDPALFHRSIAENIAYARPGATEDEVRLAARRARAEGFIDRLPQGYDTLVGERGVKLSGGERQRVAIARAFLADAPILVFDEATSSLDVETERVVQAAMEELMAGRTTIVIAHRLSTIRGADRILVFENGRIVEEGRHGDLKERGGLYARLAAMTEGTA